MKHFWLLMLALLLLVATFTACSGNSGDENARLVYELSADGESYYVVENKTPDAKVAEIPETHKGKPVVSIGESAFARSAGLTKVIIPDSVTGINSYAFGNCTALTEIVVPDSVTSIGSDAFKGCTALTEIMLPDSVTTVGSNAFEGCTALTEIVIPNSVTRLGNYAFLNCTALKKAVLPYGMTSVPDFVFSGCTSLAELVIPDSVTSIGYSAFDGCTSLNEIVIPDSVTKINSYAFGGCTGITEIVIPSSVTAIGEGAFVNCSGLSSISVADGNTVYHSEGNCLIDTEWKGLIAGCKNSVIPTDGSVTRIGGDAFSGCTSLAELVIPDSVTDIGFLAFSGCTSLAELVIPNSVTSIGYSAFDGCTSLNEIVIPASVTHIGGAPNPYLFMGCTGLESITVADGNTVYHSAGNCLIDTKQKILIDGCKTSVIPKDGSVTVIGDHAFAFRTDLTEIVIPASVTSIDRFAFLRCEDLKVIRFDGTKAQWEQISKGKEWDKGIAAYTVFCTDGELIKSVTQ